MLDAKCTYAVLHHNCSALSWTMFSLFHLAPRYTQFEIKDTECPQRAYHSGDASVEHSGEHQLAGWKGGPGFTARRTFFRFICVCQQDGRGRLCSAQLSVFGRTDTPQVRNQPTQRGFRCQVSSGCVHDDGYHEADDRVVACSSTTSNASQLIPSKLRDLPN
jgi:hypothetical protein